MLFKLYDKEMRALCNFKPGLLKPTQSNTEKGKVRLDLDLLARHSSFAIA